MRIPKYRVRPDRDLAFVEVNGERLSLPGVAGSEESREAYRSVLAEYLSTHRKPEKRPLRAFWAISVAEVVGAWLDHCQTYYLCTSHTRSNEYQNCRLAVRPLVALYGDLPISTLRPADVRDLRERLASGAWASATAKRPIRPWSRRHINSSIGKIKRMLRWGVEHDRVPPETAALIAAIQPLREGRSQARETLPTGPVADEVVDATIPHLPPVVAAMVELQRLSGMRSDNLCSLRPMDLDRSGAVWWYRPSAHKGTHRAKSLAVPLGPRCQVALAPFLDRPEEEFCFSPRETGKYTAHNGRKRRRATRYSTGTYRNAVRRAARKAGVPHWHPHQLRHLRAESVKRLGGLEAARAYLGHSSVTTTEIYDARDLERAERIAREIG